MSEELHWQPVLEEALQLSRKAVANDSAVKYGLAIDFYDKSILALDEVLLSIPDGTAEYRHILQIRERYDNRIELLRVSELRRNDGFVASLFGSSNSNANSQRLAFCPLTDEEMNERKLAAEPAPSSLLLMPYWILRSISTTMTHGGFLNKRLFIPLVMWHQVGVRFAGIAVKTHAFKNMCACVTEHVLPLKQVCNLNFSSRSSGSSSSSSDRRYGVESAVVSPQSQFGGKCNVSNLKYNLESSNVPLEEISLESVHSIYVSFVSAYADICVIQNTLAKSFPYILEVDDVNADRNRSNAAGKSSNHHAASTSSWIGGGGDTQRGASLTPIAQTERETGFLARASGVLGRAGNIFSIGASSITKNVRKIAEVGISRINAIHAKTTAEEMFMYVSTATALADQCQLFQTWYLYLDDVRNALLNVSERDTAADIDDVDAAACDGNGKGTYTGAASSGEGRDNMHVHVVAMLESIMAILLHITRSIKDSMCEILLRDIQELHASYMQGLQSSIITED